MTTEVNPPAVATCPSCAEPVPPGTKWCEACGADLDAEPRLPCVACGETAVEVDGYCHSCGRRQPGPRDHVEIDQGSVVAVSDRGQRHHHNEDAVAAVELDAERAVLVVCDGVSTTPGSAELSAQVAQVMAESLTRSLGTVDLEPGPLPDEMLLAALAAVRDHVTTDPVDVSDAANPPSTTLVAAVARRTADGVWLSLLWLGDSRVYWLAGTDRDQGEPATDARLLTSDHEIAGALARWVGLDALEHEPEIAHYHVADNVRAGGDRGPVDLGPADSPAGLLVVCSDGLWRYFDPARGEPLAALVDRLGSDGHHGLDLARALVGFANDRGGHDNISVALWPVAASASDGGQTTGHDVAAAPAPQANPVLTESTLREESQP